MAIEDIISEEIETRAPNMEIAQGGPEDFMTEDEMDPSQDPELQQLLESLPGEQAEVLMQLIKEFKMAVAQGFEGEFEDFVKMKMASAQGGSEEDFMTEDEMIIPDEEIQSMIPMGQQVAQGGRIGYDQGGGIMDVVAEEQIQTGPTPQQLIMEWLEARGLPPTPENIQRAILEMSREGQGPTMPREQMYSPPMEQPRVPTGELPEGVVGQPGAEVVEMGPRGEEAGIMQTEDPILYDSDEQTQWRQELDKLSNIPHGALAPESILFLKDEKIKEGVNKGWISQEDYLKNWQMPFFGQRGEQWTSNIDRYRDWGGLAQGGRAGYQYGNEVTADDPGVVSRIPPDQANLIEGGQRYEKEMWDVWQEFYDRFPDSEDHTEENFINFLARNQFEDAMNTPGYEGGILSLKDIADSITKQGVTNAFRKLTRDSGAEDYPGLAQGGRARYGLGSLVKKIFKGGKKLVKGLTKSVKKFVKSPIGKMALMYMATAGMANIGAGGWAGAQPWSKGAWLKPSNVLGLGKTGWGNIGKSFTNLGLGAGAGGAGGAGTGAAVSTGSTAALPPQLGGTGTLPYLYNKSAADPTSFLSGLRKSFKKNPFPWIAGLSAGAGLYAAKNPGKDNIEEMMRNYKGEVSDWDDMIASIRSGQGVTPFATDNVLFPYPNYYQLAEGGRVGRAEGGLMDLGGMEKDYRAEGGFVPIGGKEKADDVPARLSRNEFVFTADAVRNAGGGDVDKGSEVMENIMTNLEKGGSISEESQGLEGARDMFEVSERLSEVV